MAASKIIESVGFFVLAGLCEIGGGRLVWQWLRESRPWPWGVIGGLVLILYGIIPTFQPLISVASMPHMEAFSSFCRFFGVGRESA
jgi:drug/metabolite transporter superfamily protein YnfA